VIDSNGNYIYKNSKLTEIVGDVPAKVVDAEAWKISLDIMKEKTPQIVEEKTPNGNYYLTVKSPLFINDEVEGVIGVAVNITDRKKVEELNSRLKMQEEVYKIAREVAHDMASPVSSLKIIEHLYEEKFSEKDKKIFNSAITSIEKMAEKMLVKYKNE
jgi:transcriptional regulator with PAS, ATPase and Fis domain